MRQRLRRPMRYGLKRGSLATTLNKMAGPSTITRPHPSSLMAQSTTMNISWPPEANGNGTGSFVLQVNLNGQPPTNNDSLPTNNDVPITNNEIPLDPMPNKIFQSPHSPGMFPHIAFWDSQKHLSNLFKVPVGTENNPKIFNSKSLRISNDE